MPIADLDTFIVLLVDKLGVKSNTQLPVIIVVLNVPKLPKGAKILYSVEYAVDPSCITVICDT